VPHPEVATGEERPDDRGEVAVDADDLGAARGGYRGESGEDRHLRSRRDAPRLGAEEGRGMPPRMFEHGGVVVGGRGTDAPAFQVALHGVASDVGGQAQRARGQVAAAAGESVSEGGHATSLRSRHPFDNSR